jgi:hypothetical protein
MGIYKKLKSALLTLLLVTSFILNTAVVSAEGEGEISQPVSVLQVAPILNELALKPGETTKAQISVTNKSRLPLPMKGYTKEFIATDEYGGSDFADAQKPDSVQNWFTIQDPDFILQPQATKVLNITIKVPQDARPGGHYATLFVESLIPRDVLSETSLFLSSRIGALFFFVVAGDLVEKGQMSELKTQSFWKTGPVTFDLAFKNEGNVDLRPTSTLTIKDWRGNVVETIQDKGQRTLPEKTRRWKLEWNKKWLIGKYTAVLETRHVPEARPTVTEVQFNAFPIYHAVAALAGLLFLIILFKSRHRLAKAGNVLMGKEIPATVEIEPSKVTNESLAAADFALVQENEAEVTIQPELPVKKSRLRKSSDKKGPFELTIKEVKASSIQHKDFAMGVPETKAKPEDEPKKVEVEERSSQDFGLETAVIETEEHAEQVLAEVPADHVEPVETKSTVIEPEPVVIPVIEPEIETPKPVTNSNGIKPELGSRPAKIVEAEKTPEQVSNPAAREQKPVNNPGKQNRKDNKKQQNQKKKQGKQKQPRQKKKQPKKQQKAR